ncbi:hypothetical protein [Persicirhabdus sediminis]|uniref:Cytochrome c7 n=1 Tax=Persicirhabdus sediminis TaxID=454144 RepID=A0A8J7MFJ5_9BACT|nr:hypothetical protein [Persicirhabdus sediminis]MBK1791812.1 hypothetical protein [Persicirhabdus sediminis]
MANKQNAGRLVIAIAILMIGGIITVLFTSYIIDEQEREEYEIYEDGIQTTWTPGEAQFEVEINRPTGVPMVDSGKKNYDGEAVMVRCNTCHDSKEMNLLVTSSSQLKDFHQGLVFNHGELSCLSCHNADNYETLRRSDGQVIAFQNVMELCGQCHGPRMRDYKSGLHGGMVGHWDLQRGGRKRNNCIDCHDPHAPAYPQVMPVFPPKVRAGKTVKTETNH